MLDKLHKDYKRVKEWAAHRMQLKSKLIANGCIEWQGARNKKGYGLITFTPHGEKTELWYAHRLMFYLNSDADLGRGIYVGHKCNNPACINIRHLVIKTPKPRNQTSTGRQRKFADEQILAILNGKDMLESIALPDLDEADPKTTPISE